MFTKCSVISILSWHFNKVQLIFLPENTGACWQWSATSRQPWRQRATRLSAWFNHMAKGQSSLAQLSKWYNAGSCWSVEGTACSVSSKPTSQDEWRGGHTHKPPPLLNTVWLHFSRWLTYMYLVWLFLFLFGTFYSFPYINIRCLYLWPITLEKHICYFCVSVFQSKI